MDLKVTKYTKTASETKPDTHTLKLEGTDEHGVQYHLTVTAQDPDDINRICPVSPGAIVELRLSRPYRDITSYDRQDPVLEAAREILRARDADPEAQYQEDLAAEDQDDDSDPEEDQALQERVQEAAEINQRIGILTEAQLAQEYTDRIEFFRVGPDPREVTDHDALQRRRAAAMAS
jgi:hypothetical protein